MLVLRLVAVLTAIGIVACALGFLLTRDARYLGWAKNLARFAVVVALVFFGLLILERVLAPMI